MINAKGEVIYTNAEIAYELGISPSTVNAVSKRLFGGGCIPHWTLTQARLIVEYIRSISVEEDAKRLAALHDMVVGVMGEGFSLDPDVMAKQEQKDIFGPNPGEYLKLRNGKASEGR